jgi:protein TonB
MAANSKATGTVNRRLVAFVVLVLLHVGLLWGLANGLSRKVVEMLAPPIEVENIEDVRKEEKEPPPPPPKMDIPPPFVPAPDIAIEAPVQTQAIVVTRQEAPPPPPPAARTQPRQDPRRPFTRPEYPPTSRRLGEEGTVVLLLLVTEDGRIADAKIDKTSGFPRLDEAAVRESKRWRAIPSKEGDKPVAAWGRFAITFRLTDEE